MSLNNVFLFISKRSRCNYADDNTFCILPEKILNHIIKNLQMDFTIVYKCFHDNP